jgi:hypothetical protein
MVTYVKRDKNCINVHIETLFDDITLVFRNRYLATLQDISLYDSKELLYKSLIEYLKIQNKNEKCYIGKYRIGKTLKYDLWDLKKIFPTIKFKDNSFVFNHYKKI